LAVNPYSNPSISMTAFQNLQQKMPHALQQIHGTNPQVVPHTQQMSKPIDLTQTSAPVPAQAAIQSTFDMDQHKYSAAGLMALYELLLLPSFFGGESLFKTLNMFLSSE
jgi:hypothetical protein